MGCGRVGSIVASKMAEEGHKVYILDVNPDNFRRLPSGLVDEKRINPVVGDGTLEDHLRKAQIEEADVFIAVSSLDTRNAQAAQIAKHIFNIPKVVARINDPVRQEMYNQLGLVAVSPTKLISDMIVDAVHAE